MIRKKDPVIKKLDGYRKPEVKRNEKGTVVSVGMSDRQKYFFFDSLESGLIPKHRTFDESYHVDIGNLRNYINDVAKMIKNGHIYIEYVAPIVEKEPEPEAEKEHDRQMSFF